MRDSEQFPESAGIILFLDRTDARDLAEAQVTGADLALLMDAKALCRRSDLSKFHYAAIYRGNRRNFVLKHLLRELSGRGHGVTVCCKYENTSTKDVLA